MKKILAVMAMTAVLLVGCGDQKSKGLGDSPVDKANVDNAPAHIIDFPNEFANQATKCDHGNRLYVSTRDAPAIVVPHDPTCVQPGG